MSSNNKKRKNSTLILIVVLILVVLFCTGLYFRWINWEQQEARVVNSAIPQVRVMTAQPEDGEVSLMLPGFRYSLV